MGHTSNKSRMSMAHDIDKIDTATIGMLRNAHMKQVQLTVLADQKANMLLGIIVVALSVIVSNMAMNELDNQIAKITFALFCATEIMAVLMALLVVVPRLGPQVQKGFIHDTHNPLYFMHFLSVDKEAFNTMMLENMEKPELVYKVILNDFYDMGLALKKKYIMLRRAYFTAAAGLLPAATILFSDVV